MSVHPGVIGLAELAFAAVEHVLGQPDPAHPDLLNVYWRTVLIPTVHYSGPSQMRV